MIDWNIEESLNLARMQFKRKHTVSTRGGNEVCNQSSRYRYTRVRFPVLPGVAVVWNDGRNTFGRSALEGIDNDEQFHQVVVDRGRSGLNDKHIFTTHVFSDGDVDLAVRKSPDVGIRDVDSEKPRDFLGQRDVGISCDDADFVIEHLVNLFLKRLLAISKHLVFSNTVDCHGSRGTQGLLTSVGHFAVQSVFANASVCMCIYVRMSGIQISISYVSALSISLGSMTALLF
mmetsp:Transcript_2163/g.3902  ORF Transcript_2163/g.3902 Transcript_2163/m.3902 type:complete len:231 (-) Transcript_2163:156-848(-)